MIILLHTCFAHRTFVKFWLCTCLVRYMTIDQPVNGIFTCSSSGKRSKYHPTTLINLIIPINVSKKNLPSFSIHSAQSVNLSIQHSNADVASFVEHAGFLKISNYLLYLRFLHYGTYCTGKANQNRSKEMQGLPRLKLFVGSQMCGNLHNVGYDVNKQDTVKNKYAATKHLQQL